MTDILKHLLLLLLCKVDFLTIKSSMFASFLCTCCFIDFKQNYNKENEPTSCRICSVIDYNLQSKKSLVWQVEKTEVTVSLYSDLLIYGNGNIWSLFVLYLSRYPDFWESPKAHHHLLSW